MFDSKKGCIISAIVFAILFFVFTFLSVDINLHAKTYEYKLVSVEKDLRKPVVQGGAYSATYILEGTDKTCKLASDNRNVKSSITVYNYMDSYTFTIGELIAIYFAVIIILLMFVTSIVFMVNGEEFDEDN